VGVDTVVEIEIERPRGEVASYASEPANAPTWYRNIESVRRETGGPVAIGTRATFVAHFLGRRLEYTYEVTELVLDERFVMATAEGPFPMETTYTFEDTPSGGTRMTLGNLGSPAGFARVAAPAMAAAMRRENRKDLARLKEILEAGS